MAILTIPFSERKAGPYTATAGQTVFFFAFPILAATDIDVWRERAGTATLLALGVDYTVIGVGEPAGGQITLTSGALLDDIIAIDGDLLKERATSFVGGTPFQAATIDTDLNRLAIMVQELGREVSRAVRRAAVDEQSGSLLLPINLAETNLLALTVEGKVIGVLPVDLGADAVATPFSKTLFDDVSAAEARATLGVRDVLSANRTYYVRPDGNDNNTGLVNNAGGAFLTIERARRAVYALDLNRFQVTVQLADGTYTVGTVWDGMPPGSAVASPVIIQGNLATPANVLISTTAISCFAAQNGGNIFVAGMELRTTTSGDCLFATKGGQIIHGNVRFGVCAGFHVQTIDGGRRYNSGNFSIVGGAIAHQHVTSGGFQLIANCTVTLSGTPAFSQYFVGLSGGYAQYFACVFSGSATGIRFLNHEGGIINTDGQNINTYLPGNAAGVGVNATFDDLYSALTFMTGGTLDWGVGDVNIIHALNTLFFNGASLGYIFNGPIQCDSAIRSTSPTGGVGYLTGAGGGVIQPTSKTTAVTYNRPAGQITMNNASLGAGATAAFLVNNTTVALGDTISIQHAGGAADGGAYRIDAYNVTANGFVARVQNLTAGALAEALVLSFQVHKGALS